MPTVIFNDSKELKHRPVDLMNYEALKKTILKTKLGL